MSIFATLLTTWAIASSSIALSVDPQDPAAVVAPDEVVVDAEGEPEPGVEPGDDEPAEGAPPPDEIDGEPVHVLPQVADPISGVDGELTPDEANAAIAAGTEPVGETLEEAHPGLDPAEYLAVLKQILQTQREKVAERLEEKIAAKQEAKMATMSSILG